MAVRVVVCGDDSVGKLSLIATFVRGEFVANVQGIVPPVTLAKDDYSKEGDAEDHEPPERLSKYIPVTTTITDTLLGDLAELAKQLRQADVILLVYLDHYTYERVSLWWMPMLRALGVNLPIVVCANKADTASKDHALRADEFLGLLNDFKEIEACVPCSAKTNTNVVECFYLCQRAVTHPIAPLFDSKEGLLKPAAMRALRRIFFLCDQDQDGHLDYKEYTALHQRCFGRPATPAQFAEVLRTVNAIILPERDSSGALTEHGLLELAFIILNKLYVERGRHETVWGILRAFHYTNSLLLADKFLLPHLDVPPNSSVELLPTGYRFLVDLFVKFDKDNDGGLCELELALLFAPTPGIPALWTENLFPLTIVQNDLGHVSLQGWLAQWNLTTYLDHRTTLQYFAYLGFDEGGSVRAVKVTKPRKMRQRQGTPYRGPVGDRNVFSCMVVGAPRCGKSLLLELFIRGSYSDSYLPTIRPQLRVKDIELRGGKQCYLILEELGELEPAILANKLRLDHCDVVCYAYDSLDPELFQYVVDLWRKHPQLSELPCVFAALKADLDKQQQRELQPDDFVRELFLPAPLHISSLWPSSIHELLMQLVDAAKVPSSATAGLGSHVDLAQFEDFKHVVVAGGAIAVMAVVLVWIFRSAHRLP